VVRSGFVVVAIVVGLAGGNVPADDSPAKDRTIA
jgi:hypothetical protein